MRNRWASTLLPFAVLVLWVVVGLPRGAGAQEEPPIPVCQGFVATIYVKDTRVVGGPDHGAPYRGVLRGTPGDDVIAGTAGPDLIKGHAGSDIICGGDGDDIIEAGEGDDRVDGGPGHDLVKGQQGNDSIAGGGDGSPITCRRARCARTAIPSRSSRPGNRSFNPGGTRSPSAGTSRTFPAWASR